MNSSYQHNRSHLRKTICYNLLKIYFLLCLISPSSVKCEPCPDPVIPHDCVGVMFVAWPAVLVACLAQEEEEPRRTGVAPPLPSPSQAPRCTALCVAIKNMASGAFLRFNCPPTGAGHSLPPFPLSLLCFGFLALLFTQCQQPATICMEPKCALGIYSCGLSYAYFCCWVKRISVSSVSQFRGENVSKLAFRSLACQYDQLRTASETLGLRLRRRRRNETRSVSAVDDDEKVVKNSERCDGLSSLYDPSSQNFAL